MSSRRPLPSGARARALRRLARHGVAVLREDNHLLAVSKPAGLASQGGRGIDEHVVALVEAYLREAGCKPGRAYVGLVHRLDRNVSGVMVLAKTSKAAGRLAKVFRERPPPLAKIYLAWVVGRPSPLAARLEHCLSRADGRTFEAPHGRPARLDYRVVGQGDRHARLEILLDTGLTHQIRVQLALAGHPLVGDAKYGGPRGRRPALHAFRLRLPHPVGGSPVDVAAPLPADLARLDRALGITDLAS